MTKDDIQDLKKLETLLSSGKILSFKKDIGTGKFSYTVKETPAPKKVIKKTKKEVKENG